MSCNSQHQHQAYQPPQYKSKEKPRRFRSTDVAIHQHNKLSITIANHYYPRFNLPFTTLEDRYPVATQASDPPMTSAVPANLFSLPKELRDMIYVYVLTNSLHLDRPMWVPSHGSPPLLCTNRVIHDEATRILYAHNRFDFSPGNLNDLPSFLDRIGPHNSKHIRHIRIDFPTFQDLHPGKIALTDESVRDLDKLRDCCSNLRTLTISRPSATETEVRLMSLDNLKVATEALDLVDARFRAISSTREKDDVMVASSNQAPQSQLKPDANGALAMSGPDSSLEHDSTNSQLSIVVEVYDEAPDADIRRKMKDHGWILDVEEREEESEDSRRISFDDYDWHGYDDVDDFDHDDYDIDNDSDFWRRAGD